LAVFSTRVRRKTWEFNNQGGIMSLLTVVRGFGFAAALVLAAGAIPSLKAQETAGQDLKDAGHDTKQAAKKTGTATKKTAKKTGHAIKKGTNKAADKTEDGARKVKDKTDPN
jgi:hypothetical protein